MKTRLVLRQVVIILVICLAGYLFLIKPLWTKKSGVLEKTLEERRALLKEYMSKEALAPSPELYQLLTQERDSLYDESRLLSELLDPTREPLPSSVREPRLYFKEKLYSVKKALDDEAKRGGTELPENLGFSEELPEPGEVPLLLRRLETVSGLLSMLIEKDADSIGFIKPLEAKEVLDPETNQPVYTELPIRLELECSTETLVDFLHEVSKASPALVVRELRVSSVRAQTLEVETLISEMAVE